MRRFITNLEIAILNKVNELGERYQLSPAEFAAELRDERELNPRTGRTDETGRIRLSFFPDDLAHIPENATKFKYYTQMTESLGVSKGDGELVGTDQEIFAALSHALEMAPRPRRRF